MQPPPIDWSVLRAAADNDKGTMKEVVSIYRHQGGKNVIELRAAVQSKDPEKVATLAHRFLGSSRIIGAGVIGKHLAALQKMGQSFCLGSKAARLMDQTEKEFIRINHYLKSPHE